MAQRCRSTLIKLSENKLDNNAVLCYFAKLTGQGIVIKGFKPELASVLPLNIRIIYIQAKIDKATLICPSRATWQYYLTASDLQTCQSASQDSSSSSKRRKDQNHDCLSRKRIYQQVCQGDTNESFTYCCASTIVYLTCPQVIIKNANKRWGGLEGLQQLRAAVEQQRASQDAEEENNKYAVIEAAKQQVEEWETSAEGQAQFAQEEKHRELAAAAIPGGSGRRKLMLAALAAHGIKVRIDWYQCSQYIRTGVGNPEQLADTMTGSKWLFENTD